MPCKHHESFEEQPSFPATHSRRRSTSTHDRIFSRQYLMIATRSDRKAARKNLACSGTDAYAANSSSAEDPSTSDPIMPPPVLRHLCFKPTRTPQHDSQQPLWLFSHPRSPASHATSIHSPISPLSSPALSSSCGSTTTSRHAHPGSFTTSHTLKQRGYCLHFIMAMRLFVDRLPRPSCFLLPSGPFRDHC